MNARKCCLPLESIKPMKSEPASAFWLLVSSIRSTSSTTALAITLLTCLQAAGQARLQTTARRVGSLYGGVHTPSMDQGSDWSDSVNGRHVDAHTGDTLATDFAAQHSSFSASMISGGGNCQVTSSDPGDQGFTWGYSKLAFGFVLGAPAHLSYAAAVSGGDDGLDFVRLSGPGLYISVNGAETETASGDLPPGAYSVEANCEAITSAGHANSGSWSITIELSSIPNSRYNHQQQHVLKGVSDATGAFSWAIGGVSLAAALYSGGLSLFLGGVSIGSGADAMYAGKLADDPPDTNFTIVALPVFPALIPLSSGTNITQGDSDALNAWASDLSQAYAYAQALYTSINRAHSAFDATNAFWETTQLNAVTNLESHLAWCLYQEPALRSNALFQLQVDKFPSIAVDPTNFTELIEGITAGNGLPAAFQQAISTYALDATMVTNLENVSFGLDPGSIAGTFPANLANTNLDSAMLAAASALWFSSPQLLNAQLLSGGQIRFDLPTLPGYNYTLQYSQDLSNPASWTSLLTTNSSANFISFTNTLPIGSKAGFYRAYHN